MNAVTSEKVKATIGAGLGAFATGALYTKLYPNPLAGALMLVTAAGGILGSGVVHYYYKSRNPPKSVRTTTYTAEYPVNEFGKFP